MMLNASFNKNDGGNKKQKKMEKMFSLPSVEVQPFWQVAQGIWKSFAFDKLLHLYSDLS